MNVLIRGMEMPAEYGRCIVIFPDGRVTTEFGSQVIATAVFVPSHGRLIDADTLAAKCDDPHWCVWLSDIEDAPTIIPAEDQ